jgi:predicted dithiol-disulfide oxidoreductase (DUF899 family)
MSRRVGTRDEWLAARVELLEEEKELTRRSDELARRRQELPWVPVEEEYTFETEDSTKTLAQLFETWQLLDRTPRGREDAEHPDWPRRHDEY